MRKENPPSSQGQDLGKLDKDNPSFIQINVSCTDCHHKYPNVEPYGEVKQFCDHVLQTNHDSDELTGGEAPGWCPYRKHENRA